MKAAAKRLESLRRLLLAHCTAASASISASCFWDGSTVPSAPSAETFAIAIADEGAVPR